MNMCQDARTAIPLEQSVMRPAEEWLEEERANDDESGYRMAVCKLRHPLAIFPLRWGLWEVMGGNQTSPLLTAIQTPVSMTTSATI